MPTINGTSGNDNGTGAPVLNGTVDDDSIRGFAGDDVLNGNGGNDLLFGDEGVDTLDGGVGNDFLDGGSGDDLLTDSLGTNTFSGGDGNDLIIANSSASGQSLSAGTGNDEVRLSIANASTVNGNAGNDTIILNNTTGNLLTGGADRDSFVFEAGSAGNVVTDFVIGSAGDTIRVVANQLTNYTTGNPFTTGHLRLVQDGNAALLQIDLDGFGPASGFVTLASLQNVVATTLTASNFDGFATITPSINDVRNDFNGDGRSDILWRNADGTIIDWLANANATFTSNHAVATYALDNSWSVAGTGDFNGDGRDDVLLRNVNGTVTDWLGQANGSFVSNQSVANFALPTNWALAGTGDFNGDGRDDILWRNEAGAMSQWLGQANGSFAYNPNAAFQLPTNWQAAATADFNGDGRDDILWRNEVGAMAQWLGQANGSYAYNPNAAYQLPTNWQLATAGDFNGDGRDDILWRNEVGAMSQWLANGDGTFAYNPNAAYQLPTTWELATSGDFNGDGRDDIMWRNEVGAMAEWLAQAGGTFAYNPNAAYQLGTSWQMQPDPMM